MQKIKIINKYIIALAFLLTVICLLPTLSKAQNTICPGESYNLTAQAGFTNYQWYAISGSNPDTLAIAGATNALYVATTAGTYIYKAKDANMCDVTLCVPMVIIPGTCCTTPNAGNNVNACQSTTINLTGTAPTTGTWSVLAGNPSGTTLGTTTGGVASLTIGSSALGTYQFVYSTGATCNDTMSVTIYAPTSSTTNTTICSNQLPYIWNGINRTAAGTYAFNTTNANGCDSIATLNLTVNSTSSNTTTATACDTYTWSVNSTTYTTSGTYTATSTNASGCPHTETLNLIINASTSNTTNATACNTYTWSVNGTTYTTSGTYTATSSNAAGCPHTETLNLTINASTSNTTNATACNTYTWSVNGTTYTTSGTYTATSTNASGCPHVETLNLTINASTSSITNVTRCSNQMPYMWNGTNRTTAGTYTFNTTNAAGCDSVATLNLTLNNTTASSTSVSTCPSALPYNWNGTNYNTAGTYTFNTTNANGCDSVATLVFTISATSTSTTNVTQCSNQMPYLWNGINRTTAGTFTYLTTGVTGCDSLATLNLTVNNTTTSSSNVSVCINDMPYMWNGISRTAAGTYTFNTTNVNGCDSVATLVLTVTPIGTIGNYVWFDANKNGLNDEAASNGINGVTVELWNATTNTMITSTTTANLSGNPGYYMFEVCANGDYQVKFPLMNGVNSLTTQTSTASTDNNSDPSKTTGFTNTFTIDLNGTGTAKDNNTIDAGYQFVCPNPNCGTATIIKN